MALKRTLKPLALLAAGVVTLAAAANTAEAQHYSRRTVRHQRNPQVRLHRVTPAPRVVPCTVVPAYCPPRTVTRCGGSGWSFSLSLGTPSVHYGHTTVHRRTHHSYNRTVYVPPRPCPAPRVIYQRTHCDRDRDARHHRSDHRRHHGHDRDHGRHHHRR